MTEATERLCVGCGCNEDHKRLEQCFGCYRFFCADRAHRAGFGRRFCSAECTRAYYFTGEESDDDQDDLPADDE